MPDVTPESLRGWAKTMESQYHRNYPLVSVERGAAIAFHAAADEIERLTAKADALATALERISQLCPADGTAEFHLPRIKTVAVDALADYRALTTPTTPTEAQP